MAVKTGCSAYDCLNEQLQQSYKSYRKLHEDGELNQLVKTHVATPGGTKPDDMYIPHYCYSNEMMPAEHTSDYLRGGVISTMATFEAFVGELVNEATNLAAKHLDHEKRCQNDPCDLKEINPDMCKRYSNRQNRLTPKDVTLHNWDTSNLTMCTCTCAECTKTHRKEYARYLFNKSEIDSRKSLVEVILKQGKFEFSYLISGKDISQITTEDKCFICIMLRFCYGIRCVMAHGNSTQTYDSGAFKDFCKRCKSCGCAETCATCKCFEDTARLVELFNKYINQLSEIDRNDAEGIVQRIPKKTDFEKFKTQNKVFLNDEEWQTCFAIITTHFPSSNNNSLPASYAYFHILRVYYWLKKSRRGMYITYGMFERINTFIHTLSFRMYLAVAQLLIDNYGLPDGVWGVEKGNIGTMITDFKIELNTRAVQ